MSEIKDKENFCRAIKYLRSQAKPFSEKLAPVYKLLNWEWVLLRDENRHVIPGLYCDVPNALNIKKMILSLIDGLKYPDTQCVSSGGIEVKLDKDEINGVYKPSMSFIYSVEEYYEL